MPGVPLGGAPGSSREATNAATVRNHALDADTQAEIARPGALCA